MKEDYWGAHGLAEFPGLSFFFSDMHSPIILSLPFLFSFPPMDKEWGLLVFDPLSQFFAQP